MNKDTEKSRNAKKAHRLAQELSEDIKMATEAMRRTVRHRNAQSTIPRRHVYEQIFSKNS